MRLVLDELRNQLHHVASKAICVLPEVMLGRHNTNLHEGIPFYPLLIRFIKD